MFLKLLFCMFFFDVVLLAIVQSILTVASLIPRIYVPMFKGRSLVAWLIILKRIARW